MRRGPLSQYMVLILVLFGFLLIALNVYQLSQLPWLGQGAHHVTAVGRRAHGERVAWIHSKNIGHLNHVIDVLERVGFTVVHSMTEPPKWNLMWSFDFPFTPAFNLFLKNPGYWQKINHLPGTGFVTLKVELAVSKFPFIPHAFNIPQEKDKFLAVAKQHPKALWVQKSNNHRGIKIVTVDELDLKSPGTFVQRFVENPLLIDGRKFDIGVYVVITSVDPLRVYIHENEILVRFCETEYHPLDVDDVSKYVVGDAYTPTSDMPSLKDAYNHGQFSAKDALFAYLQQRGDDPGELWRRVKDTVRLVYHAKERAMTGVFKDYASRHNFFELVRFDFVIDEQLGIWLMEVNMSPNLSSVSHSDNRPLYEQVIFNTLSLAGVASYFAQPESNDNRQLSVSDRDIAVDSQHCALPICLESCQDMKCQLCHHCLNDYMKLNIKHAYLEHINRGTFRRIAPSPLNHANGEHEQSQGEASVTNAILEHWFREKCILDSSWCQ